jgi:leucyl-tRNA---protein transferase
MILDRPEIINEEFHAAEVKPAMLDVLLADGWRHFGTHFFRYNYGIYETEIRRVLPLRLLVKDFKPSKSQRRVLNRNLDLVAEVVPVNITPEIEELFHRHKSRFKSGVPNSIYDFISRDSAAPTECYSLLVRDRNLIVAASFFDVGATSISSIYAIFDPEIPSRSLGIFTMLKEIEFAREQGKTLYYHGYAYEGESFYDYKKRFRATEVFDWKGSWNPLGLV